MLFHGNSKKNNQPHHLYQINDDEENDIYKYGICGRPLLPDDSSPRANEQITEYNHVVGYDRFSADVIETDIPGRAVALEREQKYINDYTARHGRPPRGNR